MRVVFFLLMLASLVALSEGMPKYLPGKSTRDEAASSKSNKRASAHSAGAARWAPQAVVGGGSGGGASPPLGRSSAEGDASMGPEAESAVSSAALDGAEAVAPRAASVLGSLKRTRTRVVPPRAAAAAVEAVDEEAADGDVVGTELSQLPRVVRGAVAAERSRRSTASPALKANLEAGTGELDDTSTLASALSSCRAPRTRANCQQLAPPPRLLLIRMLVLLEPRWRGRR